MVRLIAMDDHITRKQEFHNPAYNDVELLDADTVFSPGQLDVRFSTLWAQYSDEMLSTAWAGIQLSFYFLLYLFNFPLFQVNLKSWLFVKFWMLTALSGNYASNMLRSSFDTSVQDKVKLSTSTTLLDGTTNTPIFQRSVYFYSFITTLLSFLHVYFSGILSTSCSCACLQKNFSPTTTKSYIPINKPPFHLNLFTIFTQ